ncbi:MAG: hypothetical protein VCC04_05225 [Myxococcota bacterium]
MTSAPPLGSGSQNSASANPEDNFFLYVEGPRDREILRAWSRRMSPRVERKLEGRVVILGGRRPARAVEHLRAESRAGRRGRGLVVLDRDHHANAESPVPSEPGLEIFTWGRRHIESYVLVASAIRRFLGSGPDASRVARLIEDYVPAAGDEEACRRVDAKRLLGRSGPFAQEAGSEISPAAIARCMRTDELHTDVIRLYERIREGLGEPEPLLEVVRRSRRV